MNLPFLARLACGLVCAAFLAVFTIPAQAIDGQAGSRIVSVGGAVTEILHALGVADRIVAVDTTSTYPEQLRERPNVGYMRALAAEGILSVRPSAVIAVEGAGPPDVLDLVRQAGVPVFTVPDRPDEAGVLDKIGRIANLTGRAGEGDELAGKVSAGFAGLQQARSRLAPVRALFVLTLQNGRPLAAGTETAADGMLKLAGATNVAAGFSGYKPLTDEAVIAARPDVIVMMERPGATPAPDDLFKLPAFSQTPAAATKALVTMDGLYLLGFGPRTPVAALELMTALRRAGGKP